MFSKTITTILLCFAFVFKLLFLDINFFALDNISKANPTPINQQISLSKNNASDADVSPVPNVNDYLVSDFFALTEKPSNEKDLVKANFPVIIFDVYSAFLSQLNFIPNPNALFSFIKCSLSPKKYLSLSILRI